MTSPRRVLFYVQHLLGVGHLKRSSVLVKAMLRRGLDVTVVAGGRPLPGIDFGEASIVRLPMLEVRDVETYRLVDERGRRATPWLWWRRKRELLRAFRTVAPRALVVDMFPFGRMQFRRELVPLLEAARRAGCVRISSMRDIVQPKSKPRPNEQMVALAERHFDRLLIHGDPTLIPLERSLPPAARLREKIEYTGYVVESAGAQVPASNEVLVSVGGGAVGEQLLRVALEARPLTRFRAHPWRVLCGLNASTAMVEALRREAPAGVVVEAHRQDFASLLRGAALSVSQAGYNTTLELLAARVPAVLVPFARDNETEQGLRCRALADRGLAQVIAEDALTPRALATAIDQATVPPADLHIDLDGAERTAQLVWEATGGS
ncbi:MAG: glycosyltransferase [Acidobacteriota bacterium]